jgi:hypothetical protein
MSKALTKQLVVLFAVLCCGCLEPLRGQGAKEVVWQSGRTLIYRVTTTDGMTCYLRSTGTAGGMWCHEVRP